MCNSTFSTSHSLKAKRNGIIFNNTVYLIQYIQNSIISKKSIYCVAILHFFHTQSLKSGVYLIFVGPDHTAHLAELSVVPLCISNT